MPNIEQFCHALAQLLHPFVEISAFDKSGASLFSYNKFSDLKEDVRLNKSYTENQVFLETIHSSKQVKSFITTLQDNHTSVTLRLRYDLSVFENMHRHLTEFLSFQTDVSNHIVSWQKQVDQCIEHYLTENDIRLEALSKKDKLALVTQLHQMKLFDYKEASLYIAKKLNLSRATLYNYLKWVSTKQTIKVHQVDTFTNKPLAGNPAGVVSNAEHLSDDLMKKITRELNVNETAFILPSKKADYCFRYFTPAGYEVNFCGHSTVGALHVLAKERFLLSSDQPINLLIETKVGLLKTIIAKKDNKLTYMFETPPVVFKEEKINPLNFANEVGINKNVIDTYYPILFEKTNKDLFIAIRSLKDLKDISMDYKKLTYFAKQNNIVAFCLFTTETLDNKNHIHMRCFAPGVGIEEDPFTGSVLGGLAAYAHQHELIAKNCSSFKVEQGHFMQRPGCVTVHLNKHVKNFQALVEAEAVGLFTTHIQLA